jgi:hypothetical protein
VKSYAETNVFPPEELALLERATALVARIRRHPSTPDDLRCHELARAVGAVLHLEHQDGFYGFVDHSWLWTKSLRECRVLTPRLGFPNLLDVYAVGSLPMVRLVDCQHTSLPHVGWAYRPGPAREDVNQLLVFDLVFILESTP